MELITIVFVVALLLILCGALLGHIPWDRAATLLLVLAIVAAVVFYLLPGIRT